MPAIASLTVADRRATVAAVGSGRLRLRLDAGDCDGCRLGCGGRCALFGADAEGEIELPGIPAADWRAGDRLLLTVEEDALRRAAFAGYGRALLGLLLAASLGFALARGLNLDPDIPTLTGMVVGLWLAVKANRRVELTPGLRRLPD